MLDELRNDFILTADKTVPDWRKMSKLAIARGYVEYETDIELRDGYFAAFALRFWHEIPTLFKECKFLINKLHWSAGDIGAMYFEALGDVFKYRAFMNPDAFKYVKDGNEDKFINGYVYRAIDSTRERYFQYYNTGKRCGVFNSTSLNSIIEEKGDSCLADDKVNIYPQIDALISNLVSEDSIFEALIAYQLGYGDIHTKDLENNKLVYSPKKVIKNIITMSDDEINDFIKNYANGKDIYYDIYKFRFCNKNWLQVVYSNSISRLRENEEVKAICF